MAQNPSHAEFFLHWGPIKPIRFPSREAESKRWERLNPCKNPRKSGNCYQQLSKLTDTGPLRARVVYFQMGQSFTRRFCASNAFAKQVAWHFWSMRLFCWCWREAILLHRDGLVLQPSSSVLEVFSAYYSFPFSANLVFTMLSVNRIGAKTR